LPGRVSRELVRAGQAIALGPRLLLELFRRGRQPTLVGMAEEGLDTSRRSARLVPVVLPLLRGPAHARGGCAPDRPMEGDEAPRIPDQKTLRAGRSHVPPAPAPGALALGL